MGIFVPAAAEKRYQVLRITVSHLVSPPPKKGLRSASVRPVYSEHSWVEYAKDRFARKSVLSSV